jgi:hypothetical protein
VCKTVSNIFEKFEFHRVIRIIVKCQDYPKLKLSREKHKQVSEEALLLVLVEVPLPEDQVLVQVVSSFLFF